MLAAALRSPALALALVLALFSVACRTDGLARAGGSDAPPEMILHAYDVPAGQAQELRNIVSSLMWKGEGQPRLGNVVVAPTGQLLVSAPPSFHEGVKQLAAAVKAMPQQAPAAVAIDYWIVRGTPGDTKVGDDVPAAAAGALAEMGGGMALSLWDHTRISSMVNERAAVERRGARFRQTASIHGDAVMADIAVTTDVGSVELRTALALDKPTVLIQAADVAPDTSTAVGAVFYVVRASLAR